jgi:hypothetical protein
MLFHILIKRNPPDPKTALFFINLYETLFKILPGNKSRPTIG